MFPRASSPPTGQQRPPAAGVGRDDLYVDYGVSGVRAGVTAPVRFDDLVEGDPLVIATLDRLGRSTQNLLAFADDLRSRGAGLRVLNLGAATSTPHATKRQQARQ